MKNNLVNNQSTPLFSVIIPAKNEEHNLPQCLMAIERSAKRIAEDIEVIVVANRCTDRTVEIAKDSGCVVVADQSKILSTIRNAGAKVAKGKYLVTVDADSRISENFLFRAKQALDSGRSVGGGVMIYPERFSVGIVLSGLFLVLIGLYYRIAAGAFFCSKEDFWVINGFDESVLSAEDIDFARRLKAHGKKTGRKFSMLLIAWIVTSCRKFDSFGDWYFIKHPLAVAAALRGQDRSVANEWWYDYEEHQ